MKSFSIFFFAQETYLSADDLRINLWHMEITDQSFNIVDIKPANMEELTEVNFFWAIRLLRKNNMVDSQVITASEFHPKECNLFVYSSSKVGLSFIHSSKFILLNRLCPQTSFTQFLIQGTIRLCDMRQSALCDSHSKMFEEPEDPTNRSFFSEIISSISDVKFSNSGRYMISR